MITIWNTRSLKAKLREGTLSDTHAFVYFFATLIFDYVGFTLGYLGQNGQPLSGWGRANALIALAMTFFGVLYVFFCNGGSRGKQFFHRYFSLSVVVGIKIALALYLIPLIPLAINALLGTAIHIPVWTAFAYVWAMNFLFFVVVGQHLRQLSGHHALP